MIFNKSFFIAVLSCASFNAQALDCFDYAAAHQGVNAGILRAIAIQETGRCSPTTIAKNTNGSIDIGCMQINSVHFKELAGYGISQSDLMNQCNNIFVGAWQYKKMVLRYGNTWTAVGAYNSETQKYRDKYAMSVYRIFTKYHLDRTESVSGKPTASYF